MEKGFCIGKEATSHKGEALLEMFSDNLCVKDVDSCDREQFTNVEVMEKFVNQIFGRHDAQVSVTGGFRLLYVRAMMRIGRREEGWSTGVSCSRPTTFYPVQEWDSVRKIGKGHTLLNSR